MRHYIRLINLRFFDTPSACSGVVHSQLKELGKNEKAQLAVVGSSQPITNQAFSNSNLFCDDFD